MSNVMLAKDSISAALAQCYVTIGERRYNLMTAIKMEAKFKKNKAKIPSLGKTGKGNKSVSWEGTGSCTMHYNTSIFREMMLNFKDTGDDVYFEMEITMMIHRVMQDRRPLPCCSVILMEAFLQSLMLRQILIWMKMLISHLMISICQRNLRNLLD